MVPPVLANETRFRIQRFPLAEAGVDLHDSPVDEDAAL
jgi:hypothetical protein